MKTSDILDRCYHDEITGCMLWKGALSQGKYPRVWAPDYTKHGGEYTTQHGRRALWHVKNGKPLPSGWRVWGTCQALSCLNPQHMDAGPNAEFGIFRTKSGANAGSLARKLASRKIGRARSVLSLEIIAEIQESKETGRATAKRLGISEQTVSKVKTGGSVAFQPIGGVFSGLLRMAA